MKKLLATVMALVLALTLLPTSVLATGSSTDASAAKDWTATDSLPASGVYKLTEDVALAQTHEVTGNLTLDFNGHTIRAEGEDIEKEQYAIGVTAGTLIFKDSSATTGEFVSAYGGVSLQGANTKFELYDVTIQSDTGEVLQNFRPGGKTTAVIYSGKVVGSINFNNAEENNGDSVTINGGTSTAPRSRPSPKM